MTFKEKHLFFGGILAMALTLSSCRKNTQTIDEPQGLENPQPIDTLDVYGTPMTIYLTNVRTYENSKGEYRGIDVVTRGPHLADNYHSHKGNKTYFIPAHINGNPEAMYVEVYEDDILVDNEGMAVIDGKLQLLDPSNWSAYHMARFNSKNRRLKEYIDLQGMYFSSLPNSEKEENPLPKTEAPANETDSIASPATNSDSTSIDTTTIVNILNDSIKQSTY